MALALFRCIGAIGRSLVIANTLGMFILMAMFALGGFLVSKGQIIVYF